MVDKSALAGLFFLLQTAQLSGAPGAATFADVYGWVYRTGKEVDLNVPAATCLGLKTPAGIFERTWRGTDAKIHAVAVGKDKDHAFVLISVQRNLGDTYSGSFWLSSKDGRLMGVCNSAFVNASYVAVKDGSLDAKFESEKEYFVEKFEHRNRWDRFVSPK